MDNDIRNSTQSILPDGFISHPTNTTAVDPKSIAIESVAAIIYPQITQEFQKLRLEYEVIKAQHEKDKKYKTTCADLAVELDEYKKKLRAAQDQIRQQQNSTNLHQTNNKYKYNVCDFGEDATEDDIHELFDTLVFIANETFVSGDYVMDCTMAIIPVFILLTDEAVVLKNTHWQYFGTFKDFCLYWNSNVVPYIENKAHAENMTCSHDTLKAEYNKKPWKKDSPSLWSKLYYAKNCKFKKPLMRAINLGKRLARKIG